MQASQAKLIATAFIKNGRNKKKTAKALKPYLTDGAAAVEGHRMLNNAKVKEALEEYAQRAVHRVEGLAEGARSEYVKLQANQDILDRAGYKPKDDIGSNKTLIINITGETASRYGLLPKQE